MTPLDRAVVRTLAYFDVFDYPLTAKEIRRWLMVDQLVRSADATATLIKQSLADALRDQVQQKGEHFFLTGREAIVGQRIERTVENERKWRRAISTAQFLELVPFIRMMAVVNTVALSNARPQSDIDVLIVTESGHLWITRMLVAGIVRLLGYHRHGDKIANRICLSFFFTADALDLGRLRRQPTDEHFTLWATQAVPLLNVGKTYEHYQAANGWTKTLVPFAWEWDWQDRLQRSNSTLVTVRKFFEVFFSSPIGAAIESWIRSYQAKRIKKRPTSRVHDDGSDVVLSEQMVKFHEVDRRAEYNQRYHERLKMLGLE